MNYHYQNKKNNSIVWLLFFFLGLWSNNAISQITISTESGTNYNGLSGIAPATPAVPAAITFVIQNTNAVPITLTQLHSYCKASQNGSRQKLWYSTTSLSGAPTIATPAWTLIGTGNVLSIPTDGYYQAITGLSFIIPAGAEYRFAVESSNGISYTNAASLPAPSILSASGVNLKVFDAVVAGAAVGYGGGFPSPANTPRAFTGRIVFTGITCNAPTLPVLSADTAICAGSSATLRVTSGSLNSATEWRWFTGSCGGTSVGTGTSLTVTPAANTTYYARAQGGCAAPGACATVTVTVNPNPGTPAINAITPICLGSVRALTISPIAITPASVTVSSGTVAINIPDNTANGVSNNLTVAGVPAGATITGIDVRLNMTHTYIGDMLFNLRAPNGSILALDKYLTGTGDAGENFVNTIISSAGTADLSSGVAPFTGIFKPDAINTPIGTAPVQNPAGFVSTAASFANLYSIPNGVWTLAMADGGPADLGILTGWTITINYTTAATSYPAIWSPSSTLYTDAAATILYDGTTPTFTVYAKPAITTTYTATSVNNGCFSAAFATTTVTVNNPVSITVNPVDATICEFGTALFSAGVTGTMPGFQWQVDAGSGTFTDITDNQNYSGATTDSLTVTNVPATWNGYRYRSIITSIAPCTVSVISDTTVLTVNATPVVTISAAPYTKILPGLTTTISVSSTPAAVSYTWFRDGLPIPSANTSSVNATIDGLGVYKATIIDVNGCTNTSGELVISDSVSTKLFIFPNPNNGQFQVRFYSITGNVLPRTLTIYDSKGAMVLNKTYNIGKPYDQMEVDFTHLSSGVYMVNLLDFSGKRLALGKVVVQ